ncbi:MAG: methionine--tRNA ligase, partial [Prevotellaceae bacterium]|jgi:methionyl-tRNA synthetase|nr:methionine--tRNA ligase [Prevotellaceae bacterium]
MNLARLGNKYLADTEPWKLAKTDMERVSTILAVSLQICANLTIAIEPFMPFTAQKLLKMLNMPQHKWDGFGKTDLLKPGNNLGKIELLFEKIEDDAIAIQIQKLLDTKKTNELDHYTPDAPKPNIAFADFAKIDIRTGTVTDCKKVTKSDKLLQFSINDGTGTRTILSGIAQFYPDTEKLIGTQVCFVANFEPRKILGIASEGMILSVEDADGSLVLIHPDREVKNGTSAG